MLHRPVRLRACSACGVLLLALLVPRALVFAQSETDGGAKPNKPLFTWRDGVLGGGFIALTVVAAPLDEPIARRFRDPSSRTNGFMNRSSRAIEAAAAPGAIGAGLALYALGRATGSRPLEDLGLHTTEALAIGGVTTALLKGIAGRARPNVEGVTGSGDFVLMRGLRRRQGYTSFPSGHTTMAFATAATVTSEAQRVWPNHTWIIGPVMYGAATLVGFSRIYNNEHWASDVVFGAAIGTISGIKVVRRHRRDSRSPDREAATTKRATVPFVVGWSVPW